jgi:hypothetical protein
MLLALTVTTILLQFTSTALLSDIKNGLVEVNADRAKHQLYG